MLTFQIIIIIVTILLLQIIMIIIIIRIRYSTVYYILYRTTIGVNIIVKFRPALLVVGEYIYIYIYIYI